MGESRSMLKHRQTKIVRDEDPSRRASKICWNNLKYRQNPWNPVKRQRTHRFHDALDRNIKFRPWFCQKETWSEPWVDNKALSPFIFSWKYARYSAIPNTCERQHARSIVGGWFGHNLHCFSRTCFCRVHFRSFRIRDRLRKRICLISLVVGLAKDSCWWCRTCTLACLMSKDLQDVPPFVDWGWYLCTDYIIPASCRDLGDSLAELSRIYGLVAN